MDGQKRLVARSRTGGGPFLLRHEFSKPFLMSALAHGVVFVACVLLLGEKVAAPPSIPRVLMVDLCDLSPAVPEPSPAHLSPPKAVKSARPAAVPAPPRLASPPRPLEAEPSRPVAPGPGPAPLPTEPSPLSLHPRPEGPPPLSGEGAVSSPVVTSTPGMGEGSRALPESGGRGSSGETAPGPATAAKSSEGAPGEHSSARSSYQALLRSLIDKHKEYPLFARRAGLEGTCVVRCVISRDGDLRRTQLRKASGSTHLDGAALRAVKGVGRFPPVPQEVDGPEVTFEIPIVFKLSEG